MKNGLVVREYLEKSINFKVVDGLVYADATSMCKPFSKKFAHWMENNTTIEMISEVSEAIGIPIGDLIKVKNGVGSWIHEELVLELAGWCDVKFRIWCNKQIATLAMERKQVKSILTTLESIEYKGEVAGIVLSKNGKCITTSKIISDFTGKRHDHVLRDIGQELESLKNISSNLGRCANLIIDDFKESVYLDSYGREQVSYELGEMATMQIMLRYSSEFRAEFIIAFMSMRKAMMNMFKAKLLEEVLPQDNRSRHYVYIIENQDNGAIKIGVGNNPEKRLKQLQTGSVSELELVYRSNLCSNAFEIESFMHNNFSENHIRGEWYRVEKSTVIHELEKQNYVLTSNFVNSLGLVQTFFDDIQDLKNNKKVIKTEE